MNIRIIWILNETKGERLVKHSYMNPNPKIIQAAADQLGMSFDEAKSYHDMIFKAEIDAELKAWGKEREQESVDSSLGSWWNE